MANSKSTRSARSKTDTAPAEEVPQPVDDTPETMADAADDTPEPAGRITKDGRIETREEWRAALFAAVDEYNATVDTDADRLELVEPMPAPAEAGGDPCPLEFGVMGMSRPVPCELREGHDGPHAHTVTWAPAG